ncbi:hypothetical protein EON65_35960, partial [archaeon]
MISIGDEVVQLNDDDDNQSVASSIEQRGVWNPDENKVFRVKCPQTHRGTWELQANLQAQQDDSGLSSLKIQWNDPQKLVVSKVDSDFNAMLGLERQWLEDNPRSPYWHYIEQQVKSVHPENQSVIEESQHYLQYQEEWHKWTRLEHFIELRKVLSRQIASIIYEEVVQEMAVQVVRDIFHLSGQSIDLLSKSLIRAILDINESNQRFLKMSGKLTLLRGAIEDFILNRNNFISAAQRDVEIKDSMLVNLQELSNPPQYKPIRPLVVKPRSLKPRLIRPVMKKSKSKPKPKQRAAEQNADSNADVPSSSILKADMKEEEIPTQLLPLTIHHTIHVHSAEPRHDYLYNYISAIKEQEHVEGFSMHAMPVLNLHHIHVMIAFPYYRSHHHVAHSTHEDSIEAMAEIDDPQDELEINGEDLPKHMKRRNKERFNYVLVVASKTEVEIFIYTCSKLSNTHILQYSAQFIVPTSPIVSIARGPDQGYSLLVQTTAEVYVYDISPLLKSMYGAHKPHAPEETPTCGLFCGPKPPPHNPNCKCIFRMNAGDLSYFHNDNMVVNSVYPSQKSMMQRITGKFSRSKPGIQRQPTICQFLPVYNVDHKVTSVLLGCNDGDIFKANTYALKRSKLSHPVQPQYPVFVETEYANPFITTKGYILQNSANHPTVASAFPLTPRSPRPEDKVNADKVFRELFHYHRSPIILIHPLHNLASKEVKFLSIDDDGYVCLWKYSADHFQGVCWFVPLLTAKIDFSFDEYVLYDTTGLDTDGYQRANNVEADLLAGVLDVKFLEVLTMCEAKSEGDVHYPTTSAMPSQPKTPDTILIKVGDAALPSVPLSTKSASPQSSPRDSEAQSTVANNIHTDSHLAREQDRELSPSEVQDTVDDKDAEELEGTESGRQRDQRVQPLHIEFENRSSEKDSQLKDEVVAKPPTPIAEPQPEGITPPNNQPPIVVKELIVAQPVVPHDLRIITTYTPVPLICLPANTPRNQVPSLPIREAISPMTSPRPPISSPRISPVPSLPRLSPRSSPRRGGLSTPSVTPTTHPFPLYTQYQSTHILSGLSYTLSHMQTIDSRIVQKVPYNLLPVLTVCSADGHDVVLVCRLTMPEEYEEHEDLYAPLIQNRYILTIMSSETLSMTGSYIDIRLDTNEDLCAVCIGAVMLETLTRVIYVLTTTELRMYGAYTGKEIMYQDANINLFIKGNKPSSVTVCESGRMIYFVCAGNKVFAFRVIHKFDYGVRNVMIKVDIKEDKLHQALQGICKSTLHKSSPRQSLLQSLAQPSILFYTEKHLHHTKEASIIATDILEDIISDVLVECDERHRDLKREEYIKDLFTLPLGYVEPTTWPAQRISVWERKKRARELLEAQEKGEQALALYVYENILEEILMVVFMND